MGHFRRSCTETETSKHNSRFVGLPGSREEKQHCDFVSQPQSALLLCGRRVLLVATLETDSSITCDSLLVLIMKGFCRSGEHEYRDRIQAINQATNSKTPK